MLTKAFPILLALAIAVGVLAELAFTRSKILTVARAPEDADTTIVTIGGQVKSLSDNEYILRDNTGSAELQTCPLWFRRVELDPDERVVVTGEIVRGNTPPKGTLYSLAVFKIVREGKPEIVIRTAPGKPPWVSGAFFRTRSQAEEPSGK